MAYKIFTAGKMGGLEYHDQMAWRLELEQELAKRANCKITFIHPPVFYDYDYPDQNEAKEWELSQLSQSDIVVFNLSDINTSIGTIMELATVYALNRFSGKNIYAIGIGKPNTEHPWITSGLFNRFDTVQNAAEYINEYLLN